MKSMLFAAAGLTVVFTLTISVGGALALDTLLALPPGSTRDQAAAKGHVLAKGELVGTYAQTIKPLK